MTGRIPQNTTGGAREAARREREAETGGFLATGCVDKQRIKGVFVILLFSSQALPGNADKSIQRRCCILAKHQAICRETGRRIHRRVERGCHVWQSLTPSTLVCASRQNCSQNHFDVSVESFCVQGSSSSCHCKDDLCPILMHIGDKLFRKKFAATV